MNFTIVKQIWDAYFIYIIIALIIIVSIIVSNYRIVREKNNAAEVGDTFYSILKAGDYKNTYKLFTKSFSAGLDTAKMNNEYRNRYQQMGTIKTDSVIKWESHVAEGDSGWACTLYYVVHYSKGTLNEMITLCY